jgi:hypothetical protein
VPPSTSKIERTSPPGWSSLNKAAAGDLILL